MSSISFDNVYAFFLIIALVVLVVVPFALAIRKKNANGHNIASLAIHLFISLLVCFALAGTTVISVITKTEVYVVADVSYSANRNLDTVDEYISNVGSSLPANSQMGVVAFGKDYQLLSTPGQSVPSVKSASVDDSQTDIVGALTYASTLFSDGVIKRIVLITDGKQTDNDASGLASTINALYDSNIYVDAIFLDDNIAEDTPEVQISSVDVTSSCYLGRSSVADIIIQSGKGSNQSPVQCVLKVEKAPYGTQNWMPYGSDRAIYLYRGSNVYNLELDSSTEGVFNYRLTVSSADDTDTANNTYTFTQNVVSTLRVLLLASNVSQVNSIRAMYDAANTQIDYYILPYNAAQVPTVVEGLYLYDEIVLSDVNIADIPNYSAFIDSVDTVVSSFGKSLITFGNLYVQNSTDAAFTSLGDMLPVRYGAADHDMRVVVFLIDNSRSMYNGGKLTRAKRAVNEIIDTLLSPTDYVGVISFNGDIQPEVIPPMPLNGTATSGEGYKDYIQRVVDSLTYVQGTNIGKGLEAAGSALSEFTEITSDVQVWLLSDGANNNASDTVAYEVAGNMYDRGIYTSCVYCGPDLSDYREYQAVMQDIAKAGCGYGDDTNYYVCNNDEALEDLMLGSISDTFSGTVVDQTSNVEISILTDESVRGLYGITDVGGYYYSRQKGSANTVLTVDFTGGSSSTAVQAPLYAWWKYGNGRVATFTSSFDSSNGWLNGWTGDTSGAQMLRNIFVSNTPEERVDYAFTYDMTYSDGYITINLLPEAISLAATAEVEITMPDGVQVQTYALNFNTDGYSRTIMLPYTGDYGIKIKYTAAGGGQTYVAQTYYSMTYVPEHNAFAGYDAAVLNRILGGRGVVSEDGNITLVNPENELSTYRVSLTVPLLITAAAALVVDVIICKLKWVDIKNIFIKIK